MPGEVIMSKTTYIAGAGIALVLAASISVAALAWRPEGKITKEVSNVTLGSAYADANDASSAISARPGDTLRYRITVVNPAAPAEKQYNDLTKIKVTDTLPTGVTLSSGSKDKDFGSTVVVPQRTIGSGIKSVSYDFTVKVGNIIKDGTLICNTATFTGNSIVNDAPRSGSDKACVKVNIPPAPDKIKVCELSTKKIISIYPEKFDSDRHSKDLSLCPKKPGTPVTPVTPTLPETPAELPKTGPNALLSLALPVLGGLTYGAAAFLQRRK